LGGAEQSKNEAKKMVFKEKKEILLKLSSFLCNDLIRRANRSSNILRPHLPIYKPQLTSTFPISHRISGAFLATILLFFYLLCLKLGLICFTYTNFYQFFFYSSKLLLISVSIAALALSYYLYNGVRHLLTDFSVFIFLRTDFSGFILIFLRIAIYLI